MWLTLFRRLAGLVTALFVTALVAFILIDLLPGDPALDMLGTQATDETLAAAREALGLNRSPLERFLDWIIGIPVGDFGISYRYRIPVSQMIAEGAAVTVPLGLMAVLFTTAIALPLGVYAAANQGRAGDSAVMAFSQIGLAVPNFWFAVLLILLFAVTLGWFDAGGFPGWDAGFLPAVKALLLPAFALALPQAAIIARVTRSAILDVMGQDFVRTARAKGLSRRAALWRHALRNAMIPVVTVMGLQFAVLLAGSVIIENVFYLPGLGRLIFLAISQNDAVVVRNMVLLLAGMIMVVNFLVDLTYALINPRLRGT
ncbi:MAG: ABC transporter permease [Azospirillaceae bacterium]